MATEGKTDAAEPRAVRPPRHGIAPDVVTALVVLGCSVLLMVTMKAINPAFGSPEQIAAILTTSIFLVVASFGQGLAILLGGIDLSVGVVMGIGGMMIAAMTNGADDTLAWAIPATLLAC